ncbi:MAG: hypothetical protein LIP09_15040 [Bacteroidales bacterium]|nr:hypothetical protein [Bacteroidales bacterium]
MKKYILLLILTFNTISTITAMTLVSSNSGNIVSNFSSNEDILYPTTKEFVKIHNNTFAKGDKFQNWEKNFIILAKEQCNRINNDIYDSTNLSAIENIIPLFTEMLNFGLTKNDDFLYLLEDNGLGEGVEFVLNQIKTPKIKFYIDCYFLYKPSNYYCDRLKEIMEYVESGNASLDDKVYACNTMVQDYWITKVTNNYKEITKLISDILCDPEFSLEKVLSNQRYINALSFPWIKNINEFEILSNLMSKIDLNNTENSRFIDSYLDRLYFYCCKTNDRDLPAKNFSENINGIISHIQNLQGKGSTILIDIAYETRYYIDEEIYNKRQKRIYPNKDYILLTKNILDNNGKNLLWDDFLFLYDTTIRSFDELSKSGYAWDYKIFSPLDLMKMKREIIINEYGKDSEEFSAFLLNDVISRYGEYSEEYDLLK